MDFSPFLNWLAQHKDAISTLGVIVTITATTIGGIWAWKKSRKSKSDPSLTQMNNYSAQGNQIVAPVNASGKVEVNQHLGNAHNYYGLNVDDAWNMAVKLAAEKGEKDAQIIQSLQETIQALTRQNTNPYDIRQALELFDQGNTKKAEEIYEGVAAEARHTGRAVNIQEAEALRHLGSLAFLHDKQKVLNANQRSTALDPDHLDGWNQLGHLYQRIGELGHAENAYRIRGELDQAITYWNKSLELFTGVGAKSQIELVQSLLDAVQPIHAD
ncbi:MAG: hypothetical protein H6936_04545 [Burkholderiales bacterium]|nr:hypothetical protein [Burkholderiales bacterium]